MSATDTIFQTYSDIIKSQVTLKKFQVPENFMTSNKFQPTMKYATKEYVASIQLVQITLKPEVIASLLLTYCSLKSCSSVLVVLLRKLENH